MNDCPKCHGSGFGPEDTPDYVAAMGDCWACSLCEGTGKGNPIGRAVLFEGNPYKVICFGNTQDSVDLHPHVAGKDSWRNVPLRMLAF